MKHNPDERFPIVEEDGTVIGSATRAECHGGSMLLHPVVHLHVVAKDGSVFLQKRSMTKDIQPGKWDTAVGGHVDCGETITQAVAREAMEELGIDASDAKLLKRYVFTSSVEREVDDARFWSRKEIEEALGKDILTPNLEMELKNILPLISTDI